MQWYEVIPRSCISEGRNLTVFVWTTSPMIVKVVPTGNAFSTFWMPITLNPCSASMVLLAIWLVVLVP